MAKNGSVTMSKSTSVEVELRPVRCVESPSLARFLAKVLLLLSLGILLVGVWSLSVADTASSQGLPTGWSRSAAGWAAGVWVGSLALLSVLAVLLAAHWEGSSKAGRLLGWASTGLLLLSLLLAMALLVISALAVDEEGRNAAQLAGEERSWALALSRLPDGPLSAASDGWRAEAGARAALRQGLWASVAALRALHCALMTLGAVFIALAILLLALTLPPLLRRSRTLKASG